MYACMGLLSWDSQQAVCCDGGMQCTTLFAPDAHHEVTSGACPGRLLSARGLAFPQAQAPMCVEKQEKQSI